MTSRRLRAALVAGAASSPLAAAIGPAQAQWIVFDPTNYAQNVLTAARELQQVNNQIQSLENQATMLINQAKNLASLPYSSLAQLEQSISADRAASHPGAAHRLQRQRHRPGLHADLSAELFRLDVARSSSSPTRRPAGRIRSRGFQDAMRVQAGVVQNLDTHAYADQCAGLVEPVGDRRAAGRAVRQPAHRAADARSSPT